MMQGALRSVIVWLGVLAAALPPAPGATHPSARREILIIDDMERGGPSVATCGPVHPSTRSIGVGVLLVDDMEDFDGTHVVQSECGTALKSLSGEQREEDPAERNRLGGRTGIYQQAPSKADATRGASFGKDGYGLRIEYTKKNKGGPHGDGGFCGYYSVLHPPGADYLDASPYRYVVFWVRGEKGGENFKVGAADSKWHALDDTLKAKAIGVYLPAGKVTSEWQLAVIPTSEFALDWKRMHGLSICFEGDLYPNGLGSGVVYIDELHFSKERPEQPAAEPEKSRESKPGSPKPKTLKPREKPSPGAA